MQSITTALTTGFGTAATDALNVVSAVLPEVIPIMAAMTVISVGYRAFKRFTK